MSTTGCSRRLHERYDTPSAVCTHDISEVVQAAHVTEAVFRLLIEVCQLTDMFMLLPVNHDLSARARARLNENSYIRVTTYFSF